VYHGGGTVLYDGMVEKLRRFAIDVALPPVNGRCAERGVAGNLNAREAVWLARQAGEAGQPSRVLRRGQRWDSRSRLS
jgi:hypothetical protein